MAAAILAAGGSSRLGEPKQLVTFQGQPLVRHITTQVLAAHVTWTAVVLGAHAALIDSRLADLPVARLRNDHWREGLSSSVRCAAAWAADLPCDGLLLLLGDQVRLRPDDVNQLVDAFARTGHLVAARYDEVVGAPALFPRHDFPALHRVQGDRGARALIRRTTPREEIPWEPGRDELDTPEDKARLAAEGSLGAA